MLKIFISYYVSEIGDVEITGSEEGILSVSFVDEKHGRSSEKIFPCLKDCYEQLDAYFKGKLKRFSVNIILKGTDFQKRVWRQVRKIPFGETTTYKDIATSLGNKKAARAVGRVNGQNKIAIIIPCHRVIGSNGKLIDYAGGIWKKKWLLKHEFGDNLNESHLVGY